MFSSRADLLQTEIDKLSTWLNTNPFHISYNTILSIRTRLRLALIESRHLLYDYLQDAMALNDALADKHGGLDVLAYRASVTYGAASNSRKALGGLMIAAAIGLLVLSVLTMSLAILTTFPLSTFILLVTGVAAFTVGVGFFRAGCQRDMAKDLSNAIFTLTPPLSHN